MAKERSRREKEFLYFAYIVGKHVTNYTVPQYGDAPDDEVAGWTDDQCILAIQKYAKRYRSERRGRLETLRDMVKIAHFACLTFNKMNPSDEEMRKIEEGVI